MNNHIDYIELKAHDLEAIKTFYTNAFGWTFTDFGPGYTSFDESGIKGGFEKTEDPIINGALIILYHEDLEMMSKKILSLGGKIPNETISFPGGRRFTFVDPSGNMLGVWSDK